MSRSHAGASTTRVALQATYLEWCANTRGAGNKILILGRSRRSGARRRGQEGSHRLHSMPARGRAGRHVRRQAAERPPRHGAASPREEEGTRGRAAARGNSHLAAAWRRRRATSDGRRRRRVLLVQELAADVEVQVHEVLVQRPVRQRLQEAVLQAVRPERHHAGAAAADGCQRRLGLRGYIWGGWVSG